MNLNIQQLEVLHKTYPQVVNTVGDIAYDADGNEVAYDLQAVTAQAQKNEADKVAAEQAQATAKASALAKLTALGLSEDEVKALVG